jgi:hypothetical protein
MGKRHEEVRPGQLRKWSDGAGLPFLITEVDKTQKYWNCKFLQGDGTMSVYHEDTIRNASEVISGEG